MANPPYYEWENFKIEAKTAAEFEQILRTEYKVETSATFEDVDLTVTYTGPSSSKTTTQKGFKVTTSGGLELPEKWFTPHVKGVIGIKLYEVENNVSKYILVADGQQSYSDTTGGSVIFRIDEDGNGSASINYTPKTGALNISVTIESHGSYFTSYSASYSNNKIYFYGEGGSSATASVTESITYTIRYVTKEPLFQQGKTYLLAGAELVTTHNGYYTQKDANFLHSDVLHSSAKLRTTEDVKVLCKLYNDISVYEIPRFGAKNHLIRGMGNYAIQDRQLENNATHYFSYNPKPGMMTISNPKQWGFQSLSPFYDKTAPAFYNEMALLGQNWTSNLGVWLDAKRWLHVYLHDVEISTMYVPPSKNVYVCACIAELTALDSSNHSFLNVVNTNGGGYPYNLDGGINDRLYGPTAYQDNTGNKKTRLSLINQTRRDWTRTYAIEDSCYKVWKIPVTTSTLTWPRTTASPFPLTSTVNKNYWTNPQAISSTVTYTASTSWQDDYFDCAVSVPSYFYIKLTFQITNTKTLRGMPIDWQPNFAFAESPSFEVNYDHLVPKCFISHYGYYSGLIHLPDIQDNWSSTTKQYYYDTAIIKGQIASDYQGSEHDTYNVDIGCVHKTSLSLSSHSPIIYGIVIDD